MRNENERVKIQECILESKLMIQDFIIELEESSFEIVQLFNENLSDEEFDELIGIHIKYFKNVEKGLKQLIDIFIRMTKLEIKIEGQE